MRISESDRNPGRLYYGCPKEKNDEQRCSYWREWCNPIGYHQPNPTQIQPNPYLTRSNPTQPAHLSPLMKMNMKRHPTDDIRSVHCLNSVPSRSHLLDAFSCCLFMFSFHVLYQGSTTIEVTTRSRKTKRTNLYKSWMSGSILRVI